MKVKSKSEVAQSCPTLATPWTAAYQAPPSMGFSRQEYWSGVPLPSLQYSILTHIYGIYKDGNDNPVCKTVKNKSEVTQSCPTPNDPMDRSPPGSSVHGIHTYIHSDLIHSSSIQHSDLKFLYIILYGYYKILAIFSVLYNTPL